MLTLPRGGILASMGTYSDMPPLMTAFTFAVDRARRPIGAMTAAQRERERAVVYPRRPPGTWLTGALDPRVGISYGTAPARDGYDIPLRIYRPRSLRDSRTDVPIIVFFHGGGWVLGNVVNYDSLCMFLAAQVEAVVVSVDYRLAPEHPAPIAAHDCVDATTWISAQSDILRADGHRLAVCGDSAGGNLAAVVAQVLRAAGSRVIAYQALIYPATDLTFESPSIDENANAPILTRANLVAFRDLYLGDGNRRDPLVSPLFGDLAGLPPALIQTADRDPLRDDGMRYAVALAGANVPVRLSNYRGAPHGFASFPGAGPVGTQHRWELVQQLRADLG